MKKNKMMRLASAMMVMTLMTTSVISGTFAKYVTKETGTDSARVAKWGVEIQANGSTFASKYAEEDDKYDLTAMSVISAQDMSEYIANDGNYDKVLAPGTKDDMVSMILSGTPEVAVRVTYKADLNLDNWVVDGKFYCPLVIKVNNETFEGATYTSVDKLVEDVEKAIEDYSKDYAPNTALGSDDVKADSVKVSWEWPFETTTGSGDEAVLHDADDTALGDAAAAGYPATVSLSIETTVTQID